MRPENRRWVSGRRFRVLLCASGMCFMIMLDSNIVAVSLPSIARDLGAAFSDIEWVVSAYVLTFAALLMPSGALADRYGRRRTALVSRCSWDGSASESVCRWSEPFGATSIATVC